MPGLLGTTTFRLASGIVALFVVTAAVIVWLLYVQTNALMTEQVLAGLRGEADQLAAVARDGGAQALDRAVAERSVPRALDLYLLSDGRGSRIAGNLEAIPDEVRAAARGGVFRYKRPGADSAPRLAVAIPVPVPPGVERRLVVGRDVEDQRGLAERVGRTFLIGFGALALAGLMAGLVMSRLVVRRIDAINEAAASIMAGDLGRRIATSTAGDEIDGLATNLNLMLDRIEQLMMGLREVSDNIAHDLKTPLNRLRNRAEAALRGPGGLDGYRDGLERTIEEADELIKTFNALLLIARLEAGAIEENMETFDVAALVRDVAELYEPVAEEAGQRLIIDAAVGLSLRANRQLIGQAVANLIDNAIKYGAQGGSAGAAAATDDSSAAALRIGLTRADAGVELTVADRGPGIAPEDRDRAMRRFVRLDQSRTRPGTGLGLSLVAAVARLHRGSVRLEDNQPGLKVVVSLPLRD